MSNNEVLAKGTRVRYHGSITDNHGKEYRIVSDHPEILDTRGEYSPIRYALQGKHIRDYMCNVRPESFTVIEE